MLGVAQRRAPWPVSDPTHESSPSPQSMPGPSRPRASLCSSMQASAAAATASQARQWNGISRASREPSEPSDRNRHTFLGAGRDAGASHTVKLNCEFESKSMSKRSGGKLLDSKGLSHSKGVCVDAQPKRVFQYTQSL